MVRLGKWRALIGRGEHGMQYHMAVCVIRESQKSGVGTRIHYQNTTATELARHTSELRHASREREREETNLEPRIPCPSARRIQSLTYTTAHY
jgi:hypothetical protein